MYLRLWELYAGKMTAEEVEEYENKACASCDHVRYVYSQFHELLNRGYRYGAKGNGTIPAAYSERIRLAKHAGMKIMSLEKDIRPRDIMTKEAFLNVLTVDMALISTTMLHLPAIAHEVGFDLNIDIANGTVRPQPMPSCTSRTYSYGRPI